MLASLKGKSGQGATAPYISTWPLYEECIFLADHIVVRKTSSSYNTNILPKTQNAAAVRLKSEADKSSLISIRFSSSPSPPVFIRSSTSPQTPGLSSSSAWSSDNDLFVEKDVESDTSDSRSSNRRLFAATAMGASMFSTLSSAQRSESILKEIKEARSEGKCIVLPSNNFAAKKKDDDALTQAILLQTSALSSMTAKLSKGLLNPSNTIVSDNNSNISNNSNINLIMSAISFAL
ncbi:putative mediator of RNA polymerase II transcription subunit 26 isoform X3 [Harpegnathos saltator]|nr:putative mediator of RNA polymerase II transcription subunit 26 isoform X3 [Harpegnathos saltator]XP_025161383.1 putative mediator of RNA polymerase II transcription subunit 26 isoform X3 [Harpegnathos saltator]XP_025161384.1 putative mediator of RNA polymerase II transcription subunit 26 isoform X3 [Harpegnathos saltator]XP_025161385.1 putative mediator of RNA polymerase II transcription subunit 26 isoform X3 [Harpegnathos saltator]XP_025161386.1 putative mediator of RNA polymerase II trans